MIVQAVQEKGGAEIGPQGAHAAYAMEESSGGGVEGASPVQRMQGASKEGGYTSDSDAPGPVLEGVRPQAEVQG